jgi:hypothetical protein
MTAPDARPDPASVCDYPNCDCPVSFPEGHRPSVKTECPRAEDDPAPVREEPDGLHSKMRALADTGHPKAGELREKADAFEAAAKGFYSDPQTVPVQKFMGAWARARRLYSECSGEPLV